MREEKRVPRVSSAHALHINIHNQFLVRLAQAQVSRLYTLIEFCKLYFIINIIFQLLLREAPPLWANEHFVKASIFLKHLIKSRLHTRRRS